MLRIAAALRRKKIKKKLCKNTKKNRCYLSNYLMHVNAHVHFLLYLYTMRLVCLKTKINY